MVLYLKGAEIPREETPRFDSRFSLFLSFQSKHLRSITFTKTKFRRVGHERCSPDFLKVTQKKFFWGEKRCSDVGRENKTAFVLVVRLFKIVRKTSGAI